MQKFKTYLLSKLEEQLDIIENSSYNNLNEYQLGYIAAINFLLDLIINYKESNEKQKTPNESNENRKARFIWTGKRCKK